MVSVDSSAVSFTCQSVVSQQPAAMQQLSSVIIMCLLLVAQSTLRRSSACVSAFAPPARVQRAQSTTNAKSASRLPAAAASTDEPLLTLEDGLHEDEQTIKKSRFIGLAMNCASWGAAQEFIAQVRADHPKARHVCFGFVAGVNPVQERASDDGEPTGTGGAPIIGAIKGENLSDVVCCVVRYSGGIKLGAGGLIRAYGGTARLALRVGPNKVLIPTSSVRVVTSSSNAGSVYQAIGKFGGSTSDECYNDKGDLEVTLTCESEFMEQLQNDIRDATKGEAIFEDE